MIRYSTLALILFGIFRIYLGPIIWVRGGERVRLREIEGKNEVERALTEHARKQVEEKKTDNADGERNFHPDASDPERLSAPHLSAPRQPEEY